MSETNTIEETIARIPFPWAVSILVILTLPLALYLGKFNFPLWVCFIVWAEYFALGGTPKTAKIILPSLLVGVLFAAIWMATAVFYTSVANHPHNLLIGLVIGTIWVTVVCYLIPRSNTLTEGTLAVFNGLALYLAVYFTKSIPAIGPMENPYWQIINASIWTLFTAYIGWCFGWINIALTFPKKAN